MHKINIVAVGNLKESYWADAIKEYQKRLGRFANVEVKECPEFSGTSKSSVEHIKSVECESVLKNMSGYVVAMDKSGEILTSEDFARLMDLSFAGGAKNLTFVIGGSNGLTKEVLEKSNKVVSFGKVTFPHQLMRVMLFEQIYRAETILNNISYHK